MGTDSMMMNLEEINGNYINMKILLIIVFILAEINYNSAISSASLVDSDAEISEVMYTYGFDVDGTPADVIDQGDKIKALILTLKERK